MRTLKEESPEKELPRLKTLKRLKVQQEQHKCYLKKSLKKSLDECLETFFNSIMHTLHSLRRKKKKSGRNVYELKSF